MIELVEMTYPLITAKERARNRSPLVCVINADTVAIGETGQDLAFTLVA